MATSGGMYEGQSGGQPAGAGGPGGYPEAPTMHGGPGAPGYGYGGPGYGRMGGGMGMGMMRPRRNYPIETKPFFLTSEFAAFLIAVLALLITAAVDNSIDSRIFWYLTTALVGLYMLSRGIAKSGTRSHSTDPREDIDLRRGDTGGDR